MADLDSRLQTRVSLLLRLRDQRDSEAWKLFVDTYGPLVYRFCRRQGLQEADTADVTQEVLAQVCRSMTTFEYQPERGRFRDWLGVVVRSKIARHHRKQARAGRDGETGGDAELDESLASAEEAEWTAAFHAHLLRVAQERIRPDYEPANWRAFEMLWLEDRSAAEVAHELGMSPSALYVTKWRILKRLREEILLLAEDIPHLVPLHETTAEPS